MILATVLDQAGDQLGGFIPRLGGALLLLLVGIVVARLVARLLGRGLRMAASTARPRAGAWRTSSSRRGWGARSRT